MTLSGPRIGRRSALAAGLAVLAAPVASRAAEARLGQGPLGDILFDPDLGAIPLRLKPRLIRVPATANGQNVEAIIDSGASFTVFDLAFAHALGLNDAGSIAAHGNGGTVGARVMTGAEIQIGGFRMAHRNVTALDLSALQKTAPAVKLVIGGDLLNWLAVDFDFPARRMGMAFSGRAQPPQGAVTELLRPGRMGLRLIKTHIEGGPATWAMMDLGDANAISISAVWAREQGLLEGRRVSAGATASVEGINSTLLVSLREVTIAGVTFSDVPAQLIEPWRDTETPVNIGLPLMRRFRLITDFPRGQASLAPDPAMLGQPLPKDRSGLGVTHTRRGLQVLLVAPGSPAEKAGWRKGDEIVAVNGRPAGGEPAGDREGGWASGPDGTVVTLTLADGSRRRLTLATYY